MRSDILRTLLVLTACGGCALPVWADEPAGATAENPDAAKGTGPQRAPRWIGVRCGRIDEALRTQLQLSADEGLLVLEVVPDGPAEKSGLKRFDVLVRVEDRPLTSTRQLHEAVAEAGSGKLSLELVRAGKRLEIELRPVTRPAESPGIPGALPSDYRDTVRQLLDEDRPGEPMVFRFVHPGWVGPHRPQLPDDVHVTIERRGNHPAKISVERDGEIWQASEDNLGTLPEALRPAVRALLPPGASGTASRPTPDMLFRRLNERLETMDRQLGDLRQRLEERQAPQPAEKPAKPSP